MAAHERETRTDRWAAARTSEAERAELAAGVGALLRTARVEAGLSVRGLAAASACASSSVSRLERGLRRPRPSMLAALAGVLDPGGTQLRERLVSAAGRHLREDTAAGLRARRRRVRRLRRVVR